MARYGPATTNPPATAQGTASQTPGIPAGFHAYTNTTIGVRFNMPDGWTTKDDTAQASGHGMHAVSPDNMAALSTASLTGGGGDIRMANLLLVAPSDTNSAWVVGENLPAALI